MVGFQTGPESMIRHQSLDFSQLPDADVIISILFLQRVVELRPFLVELMEPLFAVVRDKDRKSVV